jgi:hypothetical protein
METIYYSQEVQRTIGEYTANFRFYHNQNTWRGEVLLQEKTIQFSLPHHCVLYGKQAAPEIDWACVDAFLAYYCSYHTDIQAKAVKRLARLARKIAWWREEELAVGWFKLSCIDVQTIRTKTFLGESQKFEDRFIYEIHYHFVGSNECYWIDTYGAWSAVFKNDRLMSAERVQC